MPRLRWCLRNLFPKVAFSVFLALATACCGMQATKQLAPGVTLYQEIDTNAATALIVTAITVDLREPTVTVKPALGQDTVSASGPLQGREAVSALTARANALVGVNADFFPFTGDPLGVCIIDGELVSEPARNRVAAAWFKNRAIIFDNPRLSAVLTLPSRVMRQIDGINRRRTQNEIVIYTRRYGSSTGTATNAVDVVATSADLPVRVGKPLIMRITEIKTDGADTPIPENGVVLSASGPAAWFLTQNLKCGDTLTVCFDIVSAGSHDWTRIEQAVGGGPWLLKDGSEFIDFATEGFSSSFATVRHPRTALGVTADGKMLIVTVDGRQSISRGITLADLAALMKRLGARDAINLDGGGSTSMSVRGFVVNSPSGGMERAVANAVLVFAEGPEAEELPGLSICGVSGEVASGCGLQLGLTRADGESVTDDQLDRTVWGTSGGIGFVNQRGYLTPGKLRAGKVHALYGAQHASADVRVVAGPPAEVVVELTPDAPDPSRATVLVRVFDRNHNTLARRNVRLQTTGGQLEADSGMTDSEGQFATVVTWEKDAAARTITATVDGVTGSASDRGDR